jgi:hypothetical protein
MSAPHFLRDFKRDLFLQWLERNNATLVELTNPYEVVRYRMWVPKDTTRPSTHIIYKRKNDTLTYQGSSRQHYETFAKYGSVR